MATKRKQIGTVTETETITQYKQVTFPVWNVYADDDQRVRWNKKNCAFEFQFCEGDPWGPMEWDAWMENAGRGEMLNTLTQLKALIEATK
jgi:hypothetical protein